MPLRAILVKMVVIVQPLRLRSIGRCQEQLVESRTGAVVWGQWPTLRFPSPLIELDVPISGIQLSDQFHREAFDVAVRDRRSRRSRPHSP